MARRAVEAVEAGVDVGDVGIGERVGGRLHRAWVGFIDAVEPDAVHGLIWSSAQIGDERGSRWVSGPAGLHVRDAGGIDDVDGVGLDDPGGGAVAVAGHRLAPFPTPERHRDAAVGDARPERLLEEHGDLA